MLGSPSAVSSTLSRTNWLLLLLLSLSTGILGPFLSMSFLRPRLRLFSAALRYTPTTQAARRFATEARTLTSDHVRIVEVGPRDGLQNEKKSIPLETKIQLIEKLAKTGVTTIEAGSFVPAKWVPQVRLFS